MKVINRLKEFAFGEEEKTDSYIEISHPYIEVKVRINDDSSNAE